MIYLKIKIERFINERFKTDPFSLVVYFWGQDTGRRGGVLNRNFNCRGPPILKDQIISEDTNLIQ